MDNILLAQEMVLELDRKLVQPNLATVDLLFRTFSNSWFSVVINGQPAGFFKSSRGVHQGDPLSPALFLFVAEFLGQGLQQLGLNNKDSCYVSAGGTVPYLAFANDTINFTRCSEPSLKALRDFLLLYQAHSGQKVNAGKSALLPPRPSCN
ncbi:uncharacterized protein [Coffea arabica]|uniref:Reverse transcriptase domain-containing protein n=1 Tax=Coffea arabica TaxID=13443 RepID=A0ABM4WMZ7_COFAR